MSEDRLEAMATQLRARKNGQGEPVYPESLIEQWLVYQRAGQFGRANRLLRKAVRGPGKDRRGLCGARTRAGGTCQCTPVPNKVRCRRHGGLSTGPKTPEGKSRCGPRTQEGRDRCRAAAIRRWEDHRRRRAARVAEQQAARESTGV